MSNNLKHQLKLFSIQTVSKEILGISESTLRRYIQEGKISIIRLSSRKIFITEDQILTFINSCRENATDIKDKSWRQ
jgi:predicted site-specific integrase-resolvase